MGWIPWIVLGFAGAAMAQEPGSPPSAPPGAPIRIRLREAPPAALEMSACERVQLRCEQTQLRRYGRDALDARGELRPLAQAECDGARLACEDGRTTAYDAPEPLARLDLRRDPGRAEVRAWMQAIFAPDFEATFRFVDLGFHEKQNVFTKLFEREYQDGRPPLDYTDERKAELRQVFEALSQAQVDAASDLISGIRSREMRRLTLLTLTAIQFRNLGTNNDLLERRGERPVVLTVARFRGGLSLGVIPGHGGRSAGPAIGYSSPF